MKQLHIVHFLVLVTILAVGVSAFFYVRPNTTLQLVVGIATSFAYVAWGIIHHAVEGDLHEKVVIEYVLVGAIAIVLLFTALGF